MSTNRTSVIPGLIVLYLSNFFERFSYYGMRAVLVLFMVDSVNGGLGLSNGDALSTYGWFTLGGIFVVLPMGLLADFALKQKPALVVGGGVSLLGYGLLAVGTHMTMLVGIVLVCLGSGLFRTSQPVLLGRGFLKENRKRDAAFVVNYAVVNIAATLAALSIGYVGEKFGWNLAFGVAAIAMLMGTGIAALSFPTVDEIETDAPTPTEENPTPELGTGAKGERLILIGGLVLVSIIFWVAYEFVGNSAFNQILSFGDIMVNGYSITPSTFFSLNPILLTLIMLSLGIWWILSDPGKSVTRLAVGLAIYGISFLVFLLFNAPLGQTSIYILFVVVTIFQSFAEGLIMPLSMSFVTRLSPVRFSSTLIAVFMVLPMALTHGVNKLLGVLNFGPSAIINILIFCCFTAITIVLYVARKPISALGHGVD